MQHRLRKHLSGSWNGEDHNQIRAMIDKAPQAAAVRLLALEARSGKIGFVIFEGPARLLDWGVLGCTEPTSRLCEVVARRVRPLLLRYQPLAVVMRRDNHYSLQSPSRLRASIRAIKKEARRCEVEFRLLRTKSRKRFFVQFGRSAKHQIAALTAQLFEEIYWRAQPERKAWHSESYHTVIFDAAATGLVAFADEFDPDAMKELVKTRESFRRLP
jgi:hypothetical protein